eukprot:scaffold240_cov369-Pavlova_lutheri.AAC.11
MTTTLGGASTQSMNGSARTVAKKMDPTISIHPAQRVAVYFLRSGPSLRMLCRSIGPVSSPGLLVGRSTAKHAAARRLASAARAARAARVSFPWDDCPIEPSFPSRSDRDVFPQGKGGTGALLVSLAGSQPNGGGTILHLPGDRKGMRHGIERGWDMGSKGDETWDRKGMGHGIERGWDTGSKGDETWEWHWRIGWRR